jgi:phage baseplate assembly protein W
MPSVDLSQRWDYPALPVGPVAVEIPHGVIGIGSAVSEPFLFAVPAPEPVVIFVPPPAPPPLPPSVLAVAGGGGIQVDTSDPLGVDISCYPDLDAGFSLVSGRTALGQALARRLETPRGGLFYDPDYGTDVREMVNDAATSAFAQQRQQQIEAEALKDERVGTATATVTYSPPTSTATIKLDVDTAAGPYTFILAVTGVSIALLG